MKNDIYLWILFIFSDHTYVNFDNSDTEKFPNRKQDEFVGKKTLWFEINNSHWNTDEGKHFFTSGKTHKSIFSQETSKRTFGEREFCYMTFLWPLKNIDFSQLIICCWLELDMSSLDVTESKIGLSQRTGSPVAGLGRSKLYCDSGLCARPNWTKKSILGDFR